MLGSLLRRVSRSKDVMSALNVHVGVIDIHTTQSNTPMRIFYPSALKAEGNVGWFMNSFTYFISGYMHFLRPKWRDSTLFHLLIAILSWITACCFPMAQTFLPKCAPNQPPKIPSDVSGYPLIIFSHGLTGTGEEQGLMFAYWAQRGFVF